MLEILKVEIEEEDTSFRVCGVDLDKSHLTTLFPGEVDKALSKYLCIVPYLQDRAEHFHLCHEMTESRLWAIHQAPKLVEAIGITEENMVPFMMMCMVQAGVANPAEMARECHLAFGECNPPKQEGNVINFPTRKPTVH